MKKEYVFNDTKYELEKDENGLFNYDTIKELVTDYFIPYDYIFVDEAYNKLRLKGFCTKKNRLYKKNNNIDDLNNYIENYCAYNCRWCLLKKLK